MDASVLMMMMIISFMLGGFGLAAFLWGIKGGQFDDKEKMMNAVLFDDEKELNDAVEQERKKEALKKKPEQSEK